MVSAPKKVQSWHINGKQIVGFGWYYCAGLDVGSVNSSLRLHNLQIKGRLKRKEHLHQFCFSGVLSRHVGFALGDKANLCTHTEWIDGFWCILMIFLGDETPRLVICKGNSEFFPVWEAGLLVAGPAGVCCSELLAFQITAGDQLR